MFGKFRLALARLIAPEAFSPSLSQMAESRRANGVDDLLMLAGVYSRHAGLSVATVSNRIVGHARLFSRLEGGASCTVKTVEKVVGWFDQNWPEDLEWPSEVLRPSLLQNQKRRAA